MIIIRLIAAVFPGAFAYCAWWAFLDMLIDTTKWLWSGRIQPQGPEGWLVLVMFLFFPFVVAVMMTGITLTVLFNDIPQEEGKSQ